MYVRIFSMLSHLPLPVPRYYPHRPPHKNEKTVSFVPRYYPQSPSRAAKPAPIQRSLASASWRSSCRKKEEKKGMEGIAFSVQLWPTAGHLERPSGLTCPASFLPGGCGRWPSLMIVIPLIKGSSMYEGRSVSCHLNHILRWRKISVRRKARGGLEIRVLLYPFS